MAPRRGAFVCCVMTPRAVCSPAKLSASPPRLGSAAAWRMSSWRRSPTLSRLQCRSRADDLARPSQRRLLRFQQLFDWVSHSTHV